MLENDCSYCKKKCLQIVSKCGRSEVLSKFSAKFRKGMEPSKIKSYFKGKCSRCDNRFWGIDYI